MQSYEDTKLYKTTICRYRNVVFSVRICIFLISRVVCNRLCHSLKLVFRSTELKMDSLIDRLIDLNHWPLAIKFCDYMHVEPNVGVHRVLAHWAVSKVMPKAVF